MATRRTIHIYTNPYDGGYTTHTPNGAGIPTGRGHGFIIPQVSLRGHQTAKHCWTSTRSALRTFTCGLHPAYLPNGVGTPTGRGTNKYVWFTSRIPPERRGDPNGVQHCLAVWWPRSDTCGCVIVWRCVIVCWCVIMCRCVGVSVRVVMLCCYVIMTRRHDIHDISPISHKKFLPSLASLPKSPYL